VIEHAVNESQRFERSNMKQHSKRPGVPASEREPDAHAGVASDAFVDSPHSERALSRMGVFEVIRLRQREKKVSAVVREPTDGRRRLDDLRQQVRVLIGNTSEGRFCIVIEVWPEQAESLDRVFIFDARRCERLLSNDDSRWVGSIRSPDNQAAQEGGDHPPSCLEDVPRYAGQFVGVRQVKSDQRTGDNGIRSPVLGVALGDQADEPGEPKCCVA
jgi:hypothetical protein